MYPSANSRFPSAGSSPPATHRSNNRRKVANRRNKFPGPGRKHYQPVEWQRRLVFRAASRRFPVPIAARIVSYMPMTVKEHCLCQLLIGIRMNVARDPARTWPSTWGQLQNFANHKWKSQVMGISQSAVPNSALSKPWIEAFLVSHGVLAPRILYDRNGTPDYRGGPYIWHQDVVEEFLSLYG